MSRFIDYWETYQMPIEDSINDYLNHDDFMIKGKFAFLEKKMKLSAKAKFNTEVKDGASSVTGAADYSLTHTVNPNTKYMIIQKGDTLTVDGNFEVFKKDDIYVSLHTGLRAEQNATKRNLPAKLHFRVHHKNDAIVSFGVEQYDIAKSSKPDVFSALGLFGGDLTKGFRGFGGAYTAFRLSTKSLLFHKYLLGLKHKDVTGYVELGLGETEVKNTDKETGVVTKKTEWQKSAVIRVMGNLADKVKAGGDLSYNFDSHDFNTRVYGQYHLDKGTFVKGRWTHKDETLTVSLNHNYRGLVTFGVTGKFNYVAGSEKKLGHVKTKFGIFTEINETLI